MMLFTFLLTAGDGLEEVLTERQRKILGGVALVLIILITGIVEGTA